MTGRHVRPWNTLNVLVDEVASERGQLRADGLLDDAQTPAGPHSGCGPAGSTTAAARSVLTPAGADRGWVGSEGAGILRSAPSTLNGPARDLMRATGFADGSVPAGEEVAPHSLIRRATSHPLLLTADLPDDADDVALSTAPVPAAAHRWLHSLRERP